MKDGFDMGLIEIASNNSFWRGVDYYNNKKVVSYLLVIIIRENSIYSICKGSAPALCSDIWRRTATVIGPQSGTITERIDTYINLPVVEKYGMIV